MAPEEITDQLPVPSSHRMLQELVRAELNTDEFTLDISAGSNKGDNYSCIIYRGRATCRRTGKQVSVIVKIPPQNEIRRKQFFVRPSFEREISVYNEIFPLIMEFQRSKGLTVEDSFHQVPHYLGSSLVDHEEVLLMRDLKEEGFRMVDRHKDMSLEHYQLMMRALARLHATSFVLKDQQPEKMERFKGMPDLLGLPDTSPTMASIFSQMAARAMTLLNENNEPDVFQRTKKILTMSWDEIMDDVYNGKPAEPFAVIGHGDSWHNNLLYKYEDDTAIDIRLLDWQCCRYTSPVVDLMYFIFIASSKAFRDRHYEHLLDFYHRNLSDHIRRLGSDPERLFPRTALDQQLLRFGRAGLIMAAICLPIIAT
ncbi:uncharacterized protein LOC131682462 [Topomyia yanbarensis]|uniref:uncharacterized protein LOC131682462 n=1 Tax=Topomyia yanbarensis TaxID=2498891 RepID=UPI00273AAC55|nr:uncharacterized protein LOC131682462 [Topomyia yanbarensis]XP_058819934.1 uncharacterized protein LOC131682462 [Topomyia yanbarensis]